MSDFNDIAVFVPSKNHLFFISEGTGDNLLKEDRAEGFVDYIDYEVYTKKANKELEKIDLTEVDGGMLMLREFVQDRYSSLSEAIPDVLKDFYDSDLMSYELADIAELEEAM